MSAVHANDGLCRLLYTSRIVVPTQGQAPDPDAIATAATRRNATSGITGSLLFVDDSFIQILEGPSDGVEETFERICRDFRHTDVQLVDLVNVPERRFPEWGMACLDATRETRIPLQEAALDLKFLVGVNARQAVAQMRQLLEMRGVEPVYA